MDLLYMEQLKDELNININDIPNLTNDFQEIGFRPEEAEQEEIHQEFIGVDYRHDFVPYSNKTVHIFQYNLVHKQLSSLMLFIEPIKDDTIDPV
ncbi:uncharacterized protein ARMOST_15190 [Armillaria ostoyae]|uniref:Uncharacterized protein n=1 Tax=Armillaria ostoyae TaxID=47428 RepID=A0A284RSP3_ARMOS|nr:uncharacterized protein ARMOST_15190 [Armillaria ostoyae]